MLAEFVHESMTMEPAHIGAGYRSAGLPREESAIKRRLPRPSEPRLHTTGSIEEPEAVEASAKVERGGESEPETSIPLDTSADFSGSLVPLQVRVPSDLRNSLKLLSHTTGQSMSEIVLRCLTTNEVVHRAWCQFKRAKRSA